MTKKKNKKKQRFFSLHSRKKLQVRFRKPSREGRTLVLLPYEAVTGHLYFHSLNCHCSPAGPLSKLYGCTVNVVDSETHNSVTDVLVLTIKLGLSVRAQQHLAATCRVPRPREAAQDCTRDTVWLLGNSVSVRQ